jgi:RNA polymerase sigma factor (sigma-70 family)
MVTADREAARDAVQEAFALALARRRQWRGEGSLEAWIWKIALRRAGRSRRRFSKQDPDQVELTVPEHELNAELAAAIRTLPPRRRLFVFLRYFADLSYDEIAESCGVSRGTVAAALAQARGELASLLRAEQLQEA